MFLVAITFIISRETSVIIFSHCYMPYLTLFLYAYDFVCLRQDLITHFRLALKSLYSLDWPQTTSNPLASALQVLVLRARTSTPGSGL